MVTIQSKKYNLDSFCINSSKNGEENELNHLSQEDKIAYIYENYQNKMFAIAKRYTCDGYLAEDAVSDSFIDIIQKIEAIKFKDCHKMPSIIKYIVKNNAIDIIRKRNREIYIDDMEIFNIRTQDVYQLEDDKVIDYLKLIPENTDMF